MTATPTIDLTGLDFSKPHATKAEIYSRLQQAGRFALLDGVLRYSAEDKYSIGYKSIRAEDWWAADHVPGRPLFPGVLMIEASAQLASWDYMVRHPEHKGFLGFGGLNETRFRAQVEPGCQLVFVAREVRARSKMFLYALQGFVRDDLVFETEVIGVAI